MSVEKELYQFINIKLLGEKPDEPTPLDFVMKIDSIILQHRDTVDGKFISVNYTYDTVFSLLKNNTNFILQELKKFSNNKNKYSYILKFIRKNLYSEYRKGV